MKWWVVTCCLLGWLSNCTWAANPEQHLLQKIAQAESHLSATQQRITREKGRLADQLRKLEQQVLDLRTEAAVATRMKDEKSLSLDRLEQRLSQWQEQHNFQSNLVNRFLMRYPTTAAMERSADLPTRLAEVEARAADLNSQLRASWQQDSIVLPNGEVKPSATLKVGPVHWYLDVQREHAGIATVRENGLLTSNYALPDAAYQQLLSLHEQQYGQLFFDPTLGQAMISANSRQTLLQHLQKGGLWVIPILLFALVAVVIALFKVQQLARLPRIVSSQAAEFGNPLAAPTTDARGEVKGMQLALLQIAQTVRDSRERDDQLFLFLQQCKRQLERWIGAIAVTASVSPLLGLLGTVSGMIETFRMMTLFGAGDPEVVSSGIAQALVTTELGLVVAIPSLVVSAILFRRAKSYYQQLESYALVLSNNMDSNDKKSAISAEAQV